MHIISPSTIQGPIGLLLDTKIPDGQVERVRQLSPRLELLRGRTPEHQRRAHVIHAGGEIPDPAHFPNLRWVQTDSSSVAHVLDTPLARSGVPVANVRGAYTPAVAECAIGLLLVVMRRLEVCRDLQLKREWVREYPTVQGVNCFGKTMGIIGYGNIGRHIARIAHAMGMRVLACKRDPQMHPDETFSFPGVGDPEGKLPSGWFGIEHVEEMLRASGVVVVTLPLTKETKAFINRQRLASIKRGAVLVHVGRGGVLDEDAVIDALKSGQLGGAGIDTFSREPLPSDSPLWSAPNTILAPHIASYTKDQSFLAAEVLIENLRRWLEDRPLLNLVDFVKGY